MTIEEFNNLKVSDEIYLPDVNREGKFLSTEVLEINKEDKTIKAFMDNNKFREYSYIQKSVSPENISFIVGIGNTPRMNMWKIIAVLNSDALNKL